MLVNKLNKGIKVQSAKRGGASWITYRKYQKSDGCTCKASGPVMDFVTLRHVVFAELESRRWRRVHSKLISKPNGKNAASGKVFRWF